MPLATRAPVCPRIQTLVRRSRSRGLSLIEILVVLSIIALITGGIALVVMRHLETARIETTRTSARVLREAVGMWRMRDASSECPTIDTLVRAQLVDTASKTTDAWDKPFFIECGEQGEITIASAGPDRKLGNADDIRVPEPPRASALAP
jgi:general secretion pathway protein G